MKNYTILFEENCKKFIPNLTFEWNRDPDLMKLGYMHNNKRNVYDLSVLGEICLCVVTGVAAAAIYDGLKKLLSDNIVEKKKSQLAVNKENQVAINIEINDNSNTIIISTKVQFSEHQSHNNSFD